MANAGGRPAQVDERIALDIVWFVMQTCLHRGKDAGPTGAGSPGRGGTAVNDLQEVVNRPKRYENVDGTDEMFVGLMLLGFALADRLQALLPPGVPKWASGLIIPGALVLVFGAGYWLRGRVKRRWTWPRTGYVAYRHWRARGWWAAMAVAFILATLFVVVLVRLHAAGGPVARANLVEVGEAALWPALYGLKVVATGRQYPWKWLIFLLMVVGLLALGRTGHGDFLSVTWLVLIFLGVAWLGSAAGTLVSYIRHTQLPAAEAE